MVGHRPPPDHRAATRTQRPARQRLPPLVPRLQPSAGPRGARGVASPASSRSPSHSRQPRLHPYCRTQGRDHCGRLARRPAAQRSPRQRRRPTSAHPPVRDQRPHRPPVLRRSAISPLIWPRIDDQRQRSYRDEPPRMVGFQDHENIRGRMPPAGRRQRLAGSVPILPAEYFVLRRLGRATPLFGQMSRFCVATDQLWNFLKGREVESGLVQEALQDARPLLHPPEPGLHRRGQLADVVLDEVGRKCRATSRTLAQPRSSPRRPAAPAPGGPAPPRPARHHRGTSCPPE
jgi:hypothetical protein